MDSIANIDKSTSISRVLSASHPDQQSKAKWKEENFCCIYIYLPTYTYTLSITVQLHTPYISEFPLAPRFSQDGEIITDRIKIVRYVDRQLDE